MQLPQCIGRACLLALLLLSVTACATRPVHQQAPAASTDAYPISDGIRATVEGTPPAYRAQLPDAVPIELRSLPPLVDRPVPPVLAYAVPLRFVLAAQPQPAPLVFIIAGTGATADSSKCRLLMRILYAVGYHVVCLPSPTSVNFMVGAAQQPMPGYMPNDVKALYALMQAIRNRLAPNLDITGYALAGYSLGGTQAAFLARYDQRKRDFGFKQVLLINPAVSLWESVQRMDALLLDNLPGGIAGVPAFFASLLADLRKPYNDQQTKLRFNSAYLFRAELARRTSHDDLAAVVGLVFRLALANMAFASDVLTDSGVLVPAHLQLSANDSLEAYFLASFKMSFSDYVNALLLPYWNRGARELSKAQLVGSADLHSIQTFLHDSPQISVITNANDPILGKGDLAFLRRTFGARAHIFPSGGHLGNLAYKEVVQTIQRVFAQ